MKRLSLLLPLVWLLASCKDPSPSPISPGPEPQRPVANAPTANAQGGAPSPGGALLDPSRASEKAPEVFRARFTTSKGAFVIEAHREWSPNGADRFYNLVKSGFFNDVRFFRAVDNFMVQFGLHGDPSVNTAWRNARIPDDPPKQSNKRGYVSFAMAGPGSRTSQVFINYTDANSRLDGMGFAPFGQVVEGMDIVDSLYKGYGEGAPRGRGPDQGRIQSEGNAYLDRDFPQLDRTTRAEIVK